MNEVQEFVHWKAILRDYKNFFLELIIRSFQKFNRNDDDIFELVEMKHM